MLIAPLFTRICAGRRLNKCVGAITPAPTSFSAPPIDFDGPCEEVRAKFPFWARFGSAVSAEDVESPVDAHLI